MGMAEIENGKFCIHSDHLAALAEKDRELAEKEAAQKKVEGELARVRERIAELDRRISERDNALVRLDESDAVWRRKYSTVQNDHQ
jgi:septal ring factor EnvC (AmiA/AmiB activator)